MKEPRRAPQCQYGCNQRLVQFNIAVAEKFHEGNYPYCIPAAMGVKW